MKEWRNPVALAFTVAFALPAGLLLGGDIHDAHGIEYALLRWGAGAIFLIVSILCGIWWWYSPYEDEWR
jgi:hypothetical protein